MSLGTRWSFKDRALSWPHQVLSRDIKKDTIVLEMRMIVLEKMGISYYDEIIRSVSGGGFLSGRRTV